MKICSRHSNEVMAALRKKGMAHLVRPERAEEFAKLWLDGKASKQEFDPYVVAALEIFSKCRTMNIYVLKGACPLCTITKALQDATADAKWTDNVTDLMLVTARVNQLVHAG